MRITAEHDLPKEATASCAKDTRRSTHARVSIIRCSGDGRFVADIMHGRVKAKTDEHGATQSLPGTVHLH